MTIPYRKVVIGDGTAREIVFDFDQPFELVGTFLYVEANPFGDTITAALDKVLAGDSDCEEFSGNVCSLTIRPAVTVIADNLAHEGEGKSCEIGTGELKELVLLWQAEHQG